MLIGSRSELHVIRYDLTLQIHVIRYDLALQIHVIREQVVVNPTDTCY